MRYAVILLLLVSEVAFATEFVTFMNRAKDSTLTMNQRWQAIIAAADVAGPKDIEEIKSFVSHADWYIRNAALISLSKVKPSIAVEQARILLKDKALVVRSAAVDVLAKNLDEETKSLLIGELEQPYNFNKKSSLWIRGQIIEKISELNSKNDRDFFVKYLFDKDTKVSEASALALAKITGRSISSDNIVMNWRNYAKEQKWVQ